MLQPDNQNSGINGDCRMAKHDEDSGILVAAKPIITLCFLCVWPLAMYMRSQPFEDPDLADSIAMLTNPVPLAVTTVMFMIIAFITPWPSLRASIAGLATAAVASTVGFLTFAFVPNGHASLALFVFVISMTPKLHSQFLRCWPSRDHMSS